MLTAHTKRRLFNSVTVSSLIFLSSFVPLFAQTATPSPTTSVTPTPDTSAQESDVKNKIKELESKVAEIKGQKETLSQQISVMDNQRKLTELRIASTSRDVAELDADIDTTTKKITKLEESMDDLSQMLIKRIVTSYELGTVSPLQLLLSSENPAHFLSKENYLKVVQAHDKALLLQTEQAKNDYSNQQQIFEDKKKKQLALKAQLESYTADLNKQKGEKQRLLTETQGNEATYQRLLSQARAQLAGFSRFAVSQGGATILSGQTACNDWGCYYNQRDANWGATPLNGTQYTLASDGCLVTSMAMVYTHYGYRNVTPQTINSNSNNFASYYPAWLNYAISADGVSASRVRVSRSEMDSELAAGRPIIVGVSYDGGPLADHFIVIVSGGNGDYKMHDPFTPNASSMSLTDKYSVASIREMYKIVF